MDKIFYFRIITELLNDGNFYDIKKITEFIENKIGTQISEATVRNILKIYEMRGKIITKPKEIKTRSILYKLKK